MLVSQNTPRIEVFSRRGEVWEYRAFLAGDLPRLESIEVTLPVDEVYFDPAPDPAR